MARVAASPLSWHASVQATFQYSYAKRNSITSPSVWTSSHVGDRVFTRAASSKVNSCASTSTHWTQHKWLPHWYRLALAKRTTNKPHKLAFLVISTLTSSRKSKNSRPNRHLLSSMIQGIHSTHRSTSAANAPSHVQVCSEAFIAHTGLHLRPIPHHTCSAGVPAANH